MKSEKQPIGYREFRLVDLAISTGYLTPNAIAAETRLPLDVVNEVLDTMDAWDRESFEADERWDADYDDRWEKSYDDDAEED